VDTDTDLWSKSTESHGLRISGGLFTHARLLTNPVLDYIEGRTVWQFQPQ